MPNAQYWHCPEYGHSLLHRWPPEIQRDPRCEPNHKDDFAYYMQPPKKEGLRWEYGYVRWTWQCEAPTTDGDCLFMVWWHDETCPNPGCNGKRSKHATPSSSRPGPGLFMEYAPTPADADLDKAEQRRRRAAGDLHRPVDGCPMGCPGPHDFTLITQAENQVATEATQPLEVEALVVPAVDQFKPDDPSKDPKQRWKGKIKWAIEGDATFPDGKKTATTQGDQTKMTVQPTATGAVTVTCVFEFGRKKDGKPERFPTPTQLQKKIGTDKVALTFGTANLKGHLGRIIRWLDEWAKSQLAEQWRNKEKQREIYEQQYDATLPSAEEICLLTDEQVALVRRHAKHLVDVGADDPTTVEHWNWAVANAKTVESFRARVRQAPQRWRDYIRDRISGTELSKAVLKLSFTGPKWAPGEGQMSDELAEELKKMYGASDKRPLPPYRVVLRYSKRESGSTQCWIDNALPYAKALIQGVLEDTRTERRTVSQEMGPKRVGDFADDVISYFADGARHYPSVRIARAVLFSDYQGLLYALSGDEEKMYWEIQQIAEGLVDNMAANAITTLTEHSDLQRMESISENPKALYRAYFGFEAYPKAIYNNDWWENAPRLPNRHPARDRKNRYPRMMADLAKHDVDVRDAGLVGLMPSENGFDSWKDPAPED